MYRRRRGGPKVKAVGDVAIINDLKRKGIYSAYSRKLGRKKRDFTYVDLMEIVAKASNKSRNIDLPVRDDLDPELPEEHGPQTEEIAQLHFLSDAQLSLVPMSVNEPVQGPSSRPSDQSSPGDFEEDERSGSSSSDNGSILQEDGDGGLPTTTTLSVELRAFLDAQVEEYFRKFDKTGEYNEEMRLEVIAKLTAISEAEPEGQCGTTPMEEAMAVSDCQDEASGGSGDAIESSGPVPGGDPELPDEVQEGVTQEQRRPQSQMRLTKGVRNVRVRISKEDKALADQAQMNMANEESNGNAEMVDEAEQQQIEAGGTSSGSGGRAPSTNMGLRRSPRISGGGGAKLAVEKR